MAALGEAASSMIIIFPDDFGDAEASVDNCLVPKGNL